MAKARRVIRKVDPGGGRYFDEQQWPVTIALVVLGAFLAGVTLAYRPLSGGPWYLTAWPSLVAIPLVVVGFIIAFQYVDNRLLRRSMQLSIVLCAILHVAVIVQMVETRIFANLFQTARESEELVERRPPKIVPEYHPSQLVPEEDRPRQDFEEPVETQTPEPVREPEQIVRQPEPEDRSPPDPQPIPIPEQERTTEPNVVRRQQPNEAAPRQATQNSKLSRQTKPSEAKVSQFVDVPQPMAEQAAGVETAAASSQVARQQAEAAATARPVPEPMTTQESQTPQLARRTDQQAPQPETSATPTLRREVAMAVATPRTQIAADAPPAPSQETSPTEVTPANTTSIKRATTSPQVAQATTEPTPEISAQPAAQPQRREAPSAEQPVVAATPTPSPNRQPRMTTRPDPATTAAAVAPSPSPSPATSVAELAPRASTLTRTATEVTAAQPAATPAAEPRSAMQDQPSRQIARATGQENPAVTSQPTATPTRTRQSGAPSLPTVAQAAEAPAAPSTAQAAATDVAAASTATRRQATASPQAAPASGEPRPAQVATNSTSAPTPTPTRRSTSGSAANDSPVVAANSNATPTTSRSTQSAVANVVTTAADVATNAGPQTAAAANPGPSAATISRQSAATNPAATRTQSSATVASASSTTSAVSGGATRAQAAEVPSLEPTAAPGGSPRRAVASAAATSSPTNVESPATAVAASGSGDPTASPARMSLTRSLAGIAGAGRSPNVDSSLPGGDSPALVASGAARRAESTQQNAPGDALSPAAPAAIARSRAGANVPTATTQAESLEGATMAGGEQIAEVTASASAALTRADASAQQGDVTAAKGTGEVDLGPSLVVAESGAGRASGGGQAELNFETQSPQIARSSTGGAPQMALATADVGAVAAPMGTSGGAPTSMEPTAIALAATRAASGGQATDSGGPSRADDTGPLAEANTATLLADSALSRADAAEGTSGGEAAAGDPAVEDEEERVRRLARAALGGGPQLAVAGPVVADAAIGPMGAGGDGGAPNVADVAASQTTTARTNADGGAPAGGAPSLAGQPAEGGASGGEVAGNVAIARAETADAAPGDPIAGGGSASPARAATGPTFAADTAAEQIAMAGAPASGGEPMGAPLAAQGVEAARLAGGAAGPTTTSAVGAIAGPEVVDAPRIGAVGDAPGRRQAASATEDGPAVGQQLVGAPGQRAPAAASSGGSTLVSDIPEVGPTSAVAQAEVDHNLSGMGQTPMARQAGDAVAVDLASPEGPGGLGSDFTPEVGINTRQARAESLNVQLRSARFLRTQVGGLPAVSTSAIVSSEAFNSRGARNRGQRPAGGKGAPSPQTEEAIERGLAFLVRYQQAGGGWSLQGFPEGAQLQSDTAATALAVLSFQGAGYNHREFQYKDVVRGGIDFLLQSQKENGDLFVPLDDASNASVWLYSHSLATIAVCEAYGMTQDPDLKVPAQKALDFIVASQHATRGGWRYAPGVGSDTSVTGWMMMALKSGQLAGLEVPTETYAKIDRWLDGAQQSPAQPYLYRYNPQAPNTVEQRHGREASKTMTAVGLLMRLYGGWKRDNPNMIKGASYLAENPPSLGTNRQPLRDTYYWYYGTQIMYHMGGEHWRQWNSRLHPLLIQSQVRQGAYAGSWDPKGVIPDRWGPHGGRLYVTTLNLLSLEVQYRHLPLYEESIK